MAKVSLKDLSDKLGVSMSTVSKALRDSYEISEETKKRVLQVASEMGYSASPYAGHLRHHKSRTIAIIVPELNNNFFIQAISGAEAVARTKDYHVLVYVTHENNELEEGILKHLQNGRVDGVIMSVAATSKNVQHIEALMQCDIPVVFFDRICHEIETAKITTDDFASSLTATEHLIKNGCRDIAFLSLSENLSIDNKRKQGYLEALHKHNLTINEARIIKCNGDDKVNFRKIKQLLNTNKPDGIFAAVEKLALTTYEVCHELKIDIPAGVKIICFSNLTTAPLLNPSLTTISQPALEMGKQAATILLKHLEKKRATIANENIVIKSMLVERASTKAVAVV
ncbi:LacI family DNA-binding transcriptional regulator [Aridibaculum aurantiacum]|uniref:LacI family DNA-binding transcriptional regulator n=1 Tax=Aridibaculum aurantiacum TaxID=2810307 RepID=UPI001A95A52F|nr:LacI family DNA-binding transcriptional regulator [Aridibaculum aurantiacum]